jgi:hypothetical protein
MANADFEAGRRFCELESNLFEQLFELEDIVGPSIHVTQMREGLKPKIKKEYDEYISLANTYGIKPSSDIILRYKNLSD